MLPNSYFSVPVHKPLMKQRHLADIIRNLADFPQIPPTIAAHISPRDNRHGCVSFGVRPFKKTPYQCVKLLTKIFFVIDYRIIGLAYVASLTSGNQVVIVVRPASAERLNVIDLQNNVWGRLSAISAFEAVTV